MYFKIKKAILLLNVLLIIFFVFACKKTKIKEDKVLVRDYLKQEYKDFTFNELVDKAKNKKKSAKYNYYDVLDCAPFEIIIPKNQTNAQSLSIVINDNLGHLLVFDGGRVEDSEYLCEIIKDNGGVVTSWFITHIHDDHIGALYDILSKKRTDIIIKEIVYKFADFDWYYSKMGDDAGIYYLFENAIKEYNEYLKINNLSEVNILNQYNIKTKSREYIFNYGVIVKDTVPLFICGNSSKEEIQALNELNKKDRYSSNHIMSVSMLNDLYLLDQDPINNTSIVYEVHFFEPKRMGILIFGDLGYEGGNILFSKYDENDKTELKNRMFFDETKVLVLSHHGQNGIDPELYKRFSPKVVVWPTSKDIYENTHGRYYTDDTKKALSEISSIEYEIKTYEETAVIR